MARFLLMSAILDPAAELPFIPSARTPFPGLTLGKCPHNKDQTGSDEPPGTQEEMVARYQKALYSI